MDRAHRIGQTKQVCVYRFVTENAIEEKVLERAAQKLRLDQLVIQQGRTQHSIASGPASQNDLLGMIQHGAEVVFQQTARKEQDDGQDENKEKQNITDEDIDDILARGEEKTAQLNSRFERLGLDDVQKFNADSAYEWNGKDFSIKKQDGNKLLVNAGKFWINPTKRERKENYSIDSYYKDVLNSKHPGPQPKVPGAPKPPKQINIQDHQFYPQRLIEIQEKETAYYRKQIEYQVPLPEGKDSDLEQREAEQQLEQAEIDEAEPLTAREEEEKKKLSQSGFSNWNRRDFTHFIQSSAKHGRNNIKGIASEFEDKTEDEVRKYSKAFWKKYSEIDGYDRYISQIEAGEERTKKVRQQKELIKQKVESYTAPLQQLQLINAVGHGKKVYTDDEDRFLVVQLHRFGLDSENLYEKIRDAIRESPMFRFDWFMLSRTPLELNRRCATLIGNIVTELEGRHSAALPHKKRKSTKQEDEYDEEDDEYGEVEEDEFVDDEEEEVEEEVILDDESPPPQPKGKRKQSQRKSSGRGKRQRTNGTRSSRATSIE
jgi:SWI/SNF-related matrix-associated actin-dependent regulator of chromatin subfamily A member 5